MKIINKIKCLIGIHKNKKRLITRLNDGYLVTESLCTRCGKLKEVSFRTHML